MRVVLDGNLSHFGAKHLLTFLSASPGGTFDAESAGERFRLSLRSGQIVWADGIDPVDVLARLLAWTEGKFLFLDEVSLPDGASALAVDLAGALAKGEERLAEARRLADLFPDDSLRFRVVNRPPGEINITAEEFQLLFQIGAGKSLAQVRAESGRAAADLYPMVKRLQMTGLVEPVADPEATSPKGKGAEPAPAATPAPAPKMTAAPAAPPAPAASAPAPERLPDVAPVVPPIVPPPPVIVAPPVPAPARPAAPDPPAAPAPAASPSAPASDGAPTAPQRKATRSAPKPTKSALIPMEPPAPGVSEAVPAKADLVATLTDDDGTMHPLLIEVATIGRTNSNTITLPDSSVSAHHARIIRTAEGFTIEDVGSRNGTFVNSEKLSEKRLLAEGDLVRLGKIILTFNLAADMQQQSSTEPGIKDS